MSMFINNEALQAPHGAIFNSPGKDVRRMNECEPISSADHHGFSVLVAHDDDGTRTAIQRYLGTFGSISSVHTASSMDEALRLFDGGKSGIKLVISDGHELIAALRQNNFTPRIILMGSGEEVNPVELHEQGLDGFVRQPFTKSEFLWKVAVALA